MDDQKILDSQENKLQIQTYPKNIHKQKRLGHSNIRATNVRQSLVVEGDLMGIIQWGYKGGAQVRKQFTNVHQLNSIYMIILMDVSGRYLELVKGVKLHQLITGSPMDTLWCHRTWLKKSPWLSPMFFSTCEFKLVSSHPDCQKVIQRSPEKMPWLQLDFENLRTIISRCPIFFESMSGVAKSNTYNITHWCRSENHPISGMLQEQVY